MAAKGARACLAPVALLLCCVAWMGTADAIRIYPIPLQPSVPPSSPDIVPSTSFGKCSTVQMEACRPPKADSSTNTFYENAYQCDSNAVPPASFKCRCSPDFMPRYPQHKLSTKEVSNTGDVLDCQSTCCSHLDPNDGSYDLVTSENRLTEPECCLIYLLNQAQKEVGVTDSATGMTAIAESADQFVRAYVESCPPADDEGNELPKPLRDPDTLECKPNEKKTDPPYSNHGWMFPSAKRDKVMLDGYTVGGEKKLKGLCALVAESRPDLDWTLTVDRVASMESCRQLMDKADTPDVIVLQKLEQFYTGTDKVQFEEQATSNMNRQNYQLAQAQIEVAKTLDEGSEMLQNRFEDMKRKCMSASVKVEGETDSDFRKRARKCIETRTQLEYLLGEEGGKALKLNIHVNVHQAGEKVHAKEVPFEVKRVNSDGTYELYKKDVHGSSITAAGGEANKPGGAAEEGEAVPPANPLTGI